MWNNGNAHIPPIGLENSAAALENSMDVPQKSKSRTTI